MRKLEIESAKGVINSYDLNFGDSKMRLTEKGLWNITANLEFESKKTCKEHVHVSELPVIKQAAKDYILQQAAEKRLRIIGNQIDE